MRNGRYKGKQHHPLVNTSPEWIMAGCPSQCTAVRMFLTLQAPSKRAGWAHSHYVVLTYKSNEFE